MPPSIVGRLYSGAVTAGRAHRLVKPFMVDGVFRQQESSFVPRSAKPTYF